MRATVFLLLGILVAASPAGAADPPPTPEKIDLWAGLWRVTFPGALSTGADFEVLMVFDRGRFHFLPANPQASEQLNARRIPRTRLPGGEFGDAVTPEVTGSYGVTIHPETTLIYDRLFVLLGQAGFFDAAIDRRTFAAFAGRFLAARGGASGDGDARAGARQEGVRRARGEARRRPAGVSAQGADARGEGGTGPARPRLGAPAARRVKVVGGGGGGGGGAGEPIDVACPPDLRDAPGNVYAFGRREI
jgi:hypothetical protein